MTQTDSYLHLVMKVRKVYVINGKSAFLCLENELAVSKVDLTLVLALSDAGTLVLRE